MQEVHWLVPREQRIVTLMLELSNLKVELRKTSGSYRRAIIRSEIRSVAREISRLQDA